MSNANEFTSAKYGYVWNGENNGENYTTANREAFLLGLAEVGMISSNIVINGKNGKLTHRIFEIGTSVKTHDSEGVRKTLKKWQAGILATLDDEKYYNEHNNCGYYYDPDLKRKGA